jgi:hypothetical protein
MMIAALSLVAGCWYGQDDFPTAPAGNTVNPVPVTPVVPGGNGIIFIGRVCVLVNPLVFDRCTIINAGGLTVVLSNQTAVTAADGTFVIRAPATTAGQVITVSGPQIVTSTVAFSSGLVPVLTTTIYQQMLTVIGFSPQQGHVAVLMATSHAGQPMSNVTVSASPTTIGGTFYAGANAMHWNGSSTGPTGITWLPGQPTGMASLTALDLSDNNEQLVDGVQVLDGGLTFVNTVFP